MIQKTMKDGRGGTIELDHNDPRYWEGPYRYEPYPKALYRKTEPGQDPEFRIVKNVDEHERLGGGWFDSPDGAKEAFVSLEASIAKSAAERNASDQRMSAPAQAEALVADRATDEMLPAIPEKPKRKYVRKGQAN